MNMLHGSRRFVEGLNSNNAERFSITGSSTAAPGALPKDGDLVKRSR